ncbi:hypothetical protein CDD83_10736 [Cordyceps sp. RAO-2017]|nr:hypothetical protein CDD83_10736 [Cordyceps sp. RAO-2017]
MAPFEKKWDEKTERDLCVAIISASQTGAMNWPRIHEIMTEIGYEFTKDAMAQRYSKVILKDFKERHGNLPSKAAPDTPKKSTSTPRKRKPAAAKTPKKGAEDSEDAGGAEDADVDEDEKLGGARLSAPSPLKKAKKEPAESRAGTKGAPNQAGNSEPRAYTEDDFDDFLHDPAYD